MIKVQGWLLLIVLRLVPRPDLEPGPGPVDTDPGCRTQPPGIAFISLLLLPSLTHRFGHHHQVLDPQLDQFAVEPVTAGSGFVTAGDLPAFCQFLAHPVRKTTSSHFPCRFDPPSILLHGHRDLSIMVIEAQIQDPFDVLEQIFSADILTC